MDVRALPEPSAPSLRHAGTKHQISDRRATVRQIAALNALEATVLGVAPEDGLATCKEHSAPIVEAMSPGSKSSCR